MAQHGRNGHQEDSGAETASYIFNPMSYNYAQHHGFSAPTVLSQQDATVMNDFFDNPGISYHHYNDGKSDIGGGLTGSAALTANAHLGTSSHANFGAHIPQQRFGAFDFSSYSNNSSHLQQHLNQNSAGDAAAGASALLGLSTSQEPNALLNADNYMTWGLLGAQVQAPMPSLPPKSHTTSQIQQAMHAPPDQEETTWAEISAAAQHMQQQQRTRHHSLQLDTSTHMPVHQSAWQTAPHSALPHTGSRRPPLVTYGSDNSFSAMGFAGNNEDSKSNMSSTIPDTSSSTPAQRTNPNSQLLRHHSMSATVPVGQGIHQSPTMMSAMSTPTHQTAAAFQNVLTHGNGSGRKRGFNQVDDTTASHGNSSLYNPSGVALQPRIAPNGPVNQTNAVAPSIPPATSISLANTTAVPAVVANAHANTTGATMPARRRQVKEPKPARANLSDAQKRQNHILSEQKRRDTMKTNFDIITKRVPAIRDGGTMSRSEILYHLANHLEALMVGNKVCIELAGLTESALDAMDILTKDEEAAIESLGYERAIGEEVEHELEEDEDDG